MKKSGRNIHGEFTVTKNCKITARVTKDGEEHTEELEIDNIKMIKIFSNPKRASTTKVEISISSKTENIEYSLDEGTTWKEYKSKFTVVRNGKIMARGKYNGETYTDTYEVTNIAAPELSIGISHTPLTANQESVTVTINYDTRAEKKLYKIGKYGELKEYKGAFEIEDNATIYAYCYGTTDTGLEMKGRNPEVYYVDNIKDRRAKPSITWSPTEVTEEVTVTVTPKVSAKKIYLKVGTGKYEEYVTPVKVNKNERLEAYYINERNEESLHEIEYITNIKPEEGPWVGISHTPRDEEVEEVEVTINADSTAKKVEYSYNGKVWEEYTGSFKVNKNCTIYARGINENGVKTNPVVTDHITNIKGEIPDPPTYHHIDITANPEPGDELDLEERYSEVKVTIDYPDKIEKRYYQINDGELVEYTGEFKVTENCIVKAIGWTINEEKELTDVDDGISEKLIDNLLNGIAKPIITANPKSTVTAKSTEIEIKYDKYAKIKRYKIDNGDEKEYTGKFTVEKNCKITAVNINEKGEKAQSVLVVGNIIEEPPTIAVDKGDYYIVRLTYPETSTNRVYQYEEEGWRAYPEESGIIFIKKSAAEDLIESVGTKDVKLKNESGEVVTVLKENLYLIEESLEEAIRNIDMKWDNLVPSRPVITLSTTEPARELTATIEYAETSVLKEYKIVDPEGITEGWKEYKRRRNKSNKKRYSNSSKK